MDLTKVTIKTLRDALPIGIDDTPLYFSVHSKKDSYFPEGSHIPHCRNK